MPRRHAPMLAAVLTLLPAAARAGVTELVSLSSTGQQADGYSQFSVISGDGRYVAFESVADNLAPIAASSVLNVFVRDRAAGTTVVANVATNGALGDDGAGYPEISRNGRYVAFESDSTNLVPNDTNQSNDVFVRDLRAGTTVRASVGAKGQQADAYNLLKAISATGRYVVFVSDAPDLVQGAASGQNLYVRDLKAGTTTLENLDFKGKAAEGIYYEAAITPDGRYLTFSSSAWTLVRQHTTDMNIYRRDRHKGETVLVSVRPDGTGGHLPSWGPFISDDGRVVAFEGASDLIVGGHNSPWSEAVARDMWTGRTELVSVTLDGREPDGNSNVQGLSADGRRVLIDSDVDDLVAGDTNRRPDLFVRDLAAGTTVRASLRAGGQQAKLGAGGGELSADGRVVAFTSFEGHLVRNDHNGVSDTFVRVLGGP